MARKPIEISLTLKNACTVFQQGDIIREAEELGQVVSARPDARNEWIMVYFMGGDCRVERFGPQTLTVEREVGEPEYEYRGRPMGTYVMAEVSKVGGGTVGRQYAGRWEVRITRDSRIIHECDDLNTGTPKTHEEIARIAYGFLDPEYAFSEAELEEED